MIDVIYLAAGKGERVGLGYPKQFARLGGKPIMVHGLEVLQGLQNTGEIGQIIIPFPPGPNDEEHHQLMQGFWSYVNSQTIIPIEGGVTRQESVRRGLTHVRTEYVLIAEAVRPFITAGFVRWVIEADAAFVTPLRTSISSVIAYDKGHSWTLPRSQVGEVQMPQKFQTELLRRAHNVAFITDVNDSTDDAVLVMQMMGEQPIFVQGLEQNIKITTPLDLVIAEAIYNARYRDRE